MPNYSEIIRLHELLFSQRKICESVGAGRTLVKRTIDTAKHNQLSYQTLRGRDADRISKIFDVRKNQSKKIIKDEVFTIPDYKELSKSLSQPEEILFPRRSVHHFLSSILYDIQSHQ